VLSMLLRNTIASVGDWDRCRRQNDGGYRHGKLHLQGLPEMSWICRGIDPFDELGLDVDGLCSVLILPWQSQSSTAHLVQEAPEL